MFTNVARVCFAVIIILTYLVEASIAREVIEVLIYRNDKYVDSNDATHGSYQVEFLSYPPLEWRADENRLGS